MLDKDSPYGTDTLSTETILTFGPILGKCTRSWEGNTEHAMALKSKFD